MHPSDNPVHHCAGCQICFEVLLEEKYGPEWWDHPDNQPTEEDLRGSDEDAHY